jgi:hypothetical protein
MPIAVITGLVHNQDIDIWPQQEGLPAAQDVANHRYLSRWFPISMCVRRMPDLPMFQSMESTIDHRVELSHYIL